MFGFVSEGNVEQGYRLSPPQKRLCTLQQEDGDRRYGARCVVLIEGALDAGLLDRALQSVVERHDSLRTTFVRPPGLKLPVQVVAEHAGPARAQLDLRDLDARRQEEELERLFRDEGLREFDPGQGSLLRATLLSLADDRHALLLSLPALCADSRTLSNIVTQLAHAYGACAAGDEPPEPALQYVQFSEWQNEILSDKEASEGEAFWRERAARAAAAPPLPFVARSAAATPAHEVFNSFIAPETAAQVRRAAQRYETTIDVYLLACWQTLLWRLTGQPEIAVGVMCDGRKFEELNDSLGLFARWLPLAVTFRRELPFSAVLSRVAEHKSEAEEWQEYFIWHERRAEGDPSRPYPEIGFEYAPDGARHTAAGVEFSTLRQYACTDRADLKLHVADAGGRLAAELHYDASLFEAADIERLAAQFGTLLASAAADPEAPVGRLEILDDGQRRQVLCEFNRTAADYPLDRCLHELVEAQVARTPDAVALIFEGECVTYHDLNTRANQLAHRLARLGAGPETPVGICLERSSEMVVGALGVLKAGAAYVPLDPEYPAERLRYMLEDARVSVLLTSARLAKQLPEHAAHTILLDADRDSLARERRHNPRTRVRPDDLAYIIYTSGSTGRPKGTMNTHRGVCNRQLWMQEVYPLTASDRVLQLSSFSFDFSVWEFWGTLSAGAALVLPRPGGHKESAYLRRLLDEQGITAAHFVPSMLQVFLEEVAPGDCRSLRRVFVGGEALSRELQERFFSKLGASLHNQYGPTETSIDVTYWDCRRDDEPGAVPIGRPNANNAVYVLDPEGRPVPVPASGELHIGGVAVGRGYFNRPELTAEKFIPDPFSEVPGARMYRTGDLARHRGDGRIDYLGRIDEQVKVRGFRIELGEVEAALASHPLVREAVVVPQQGPSGDRRLVGFVVCTRPQAVSAAELRAYAAAKLPEFMLPALVVELERMPLTGSGKANRLALAQTEVAAAARAGEETAPRTLVEELVCGIWAEVLGVEGVGVSDNFFELGGHSLLATRVVSRVREAFGVELELRELFDGPTVEELGRGIEGRLSAGAGPGGPPLRREEREGPLPLSFAQQRLWFIEQMRSGGAAYNLPAAFRLKGRLNAAALEQTLGEIARRHETLRTIFETEQGRPQQVVKGGGGIGFMTADLRRLAPPARAEQVRRLAAEEAGRGFDLSRGPLVRARLLAVAADEHVLLLTMHHIVSDGWSMGLFIRETAELYAAYTAGLPSPLAELPVQYADFARWQREWLSGAALDRQLAYWRGRLTGVSALELPTDYPRPAVQTHRGAREAIEIDAGLSERLRQLSRREGVTLFMTLLAAFEVLLHRYSGQQEIIVGTPIAGRNHKEIEGLIGFFVNTLVLRGDVRGGDSYRELLTATREVMLGAYAHQDVPFEKLVEELQPQRDLSRSPLFQVMFSFQPPAGDAVELPGLTVEAEPVGNATAKFDLTVDLKDGEQGLYGELEYNTDLFAPETACRMVRHFRQLLASLADAPEQKVSEVALLTEGERAEILGAWNRTAAEYPASECVHELIAAQACRAPDQVAVASGAESVTYRELEQRADRLADYLAARGVGPEVRVGICVERGVELLVALLGILKAGGAYVPLDPGYPKERLAYMVEDSQVAVLLTEESLRERLPDCAAEVVCLDARRDEIARASERPRGARVGGDNLAYVIYTSGSTGRPKGVMISHRALVNLLCSMREQPGLSEEDVLLAVTSISFDIAALELYLPLLVGARVRLADRRTAADGEALRRELIDSGATVMQATPTTWRVLLESGWRNETRIKAISGGEPLPEALSRTLSELTPSLWNVYGPTETTIWSTALRVAGPGAVTIGRPVANTQIYILGEGGQPTPVGVAGHLLIGGDGLARGYHLRPGLTAERFVPDPFGGRAGGRLYQTGDLARYRPDGQIEFLGRNDQQVKIRGYRIETGEVEAALNRHPGVRASVVAPYAGEGDLRLAAYLLSDDPQGLDPVELRRFLKERLPEYMIPTAFVRLEDFPRTPNGKIDRRALPAPAQTPAPGGRASLAARTPIEEALVRIWGELLGAEPASVHDNFFELGGYSLLAMQMNHRLRETFRLDIPLVALFESPTIAELAGEVARRRAEQGDSHPPAASAPVITPDPANRHEPFPLNDVQQAYWIGRESSFELGGVASHSYTEIDFLVLDVERLNDALRRVIERHDMLRAIVLPDGRQRVLREVPPYRIAVHDLSAGRDGEVEAHLRTMRERMSHQVLPTDRWPLFDVQATRMPGGKVRLHFSLDYLIVDAWSLGLVFGEIFEFYEQPELQPPAPELSFRDFVLAELAEQETEAYKEAERYWLGRLPTLPPAPDLPLAVSPETLHRPRFVRRAATLSRERWQRIKAHGLRHGLTPTAVLLGAFSEILAAWSKSPRFTVNLTIFNRPPVHPEILDIVGDFTSLTLLEVDGARAGSFGLRARAIQEQLWNDLERRAVSGIRVQRELARTQSKQATSIMPVVFTSTLGQRDQAIDPTAGGQARPDLNEQVYTITQTPQVWLDHQVGEVGGELLFNWDAVEDLFFPGVLDDMWQAYNRLLDSLCEEAAWQQHARGWLPEAQEAQRRLVNATDAPLPQGLLHTGFIEQARIRRDEPAVIGVDRTLTYGELDDWSTALARHLQHLGVRPNRLVAVVMEKGWEQVVAVLAVLKAGAAYLPIDAHLPAERLRYLLEHGEVSVALTQPWLSPRIEWPAGVTLLVVDDAPPPVTGLAALADPQVEPTDLAYVIFTSGSTGQPKGVMIDHRGALNTVVDVNRRFDITAADRVLALSALNFDLSVYDLFGLLAAGGAVVMPAATGARDPGHWLSLVEAHGVTVWNTVPALMEMLVHYVGAGAEAPTLRVVLLSGDWIPVSLPERVRALNPSARVVSLGGATEASIWSILYEVEEVGADWRSIPYGRPMENQQFHVLNEALEPCPVWVTGQLHIGGVGLAQGYWKDEEKSARSFIRHPESGERLYRTGDMGRYLPEGEIEFLGREDTQVKVEGHRIELGEVEAALEGHERVRGAVALTVGSQRTNRRLIAYVTLEDELSDADRTLREFLRTKLPHYMVPQSVSVIESLPLTANGKIDRRALAALEVAPAAPEAVREFVAPRTPLEEKVAGIWADILGAERVGVNDSFFDLGGNSLAAIRIITRLRDTFGVEVPLRQLFQKNTVADVAEILGQLEDRKEQERAATFRSYEIEPDRVHRYEPFPLNDVQHAYWIGRNQFFELGSVAAHGYAEYDFQQLDLPRLETAIRRLIERHDMLRAVVLSDGRQQVLESVPPYRLEPVDLRGRTPAEVDAWLEATRERMSHQVLPLSRWPLFDMAVALLDGDRVRLHLGIDIIIIDAWSSRVLAYELGVLYKDPEAALPPLELSFRDYVLAEREFQSSPLYGESASYWKERLEQLPAAPELPMVKSPAQVKTPRFVRREARLEAERWGRLKTRAAQAQLTPSALLLAAFGETLAAWSKQPNFTVNLTLFNRLPLHPQVNDIIGDFTSIILVPVDASGDGTFEERAGRLQSQLLEILEHRYMSGVAVLREIARSQKRAPGALTPIVFTSNLFGDSSGEEDGDGAGGLLAERVYAVSQTPQVWLDHQAVEHGGVLDFSWDVVEELFPEGLFDDLFDSYFRLLCSLADSEGAWQERRRPALPPHQARQRQEVNATDAPIPEGLLHTPFLTQATLRPDEPAVIGVDRTLTYGELDDWSTALARHLQHLGVRPNRLVAVVMEKGWEQVVAVLAVLKAGAAYLPIDAHLPAERLRYLLEHGEVSVALTQPWLSPRIEWPAGVTLLVVDDAPPPVAGLAALADPQVEPTDLAYVIFTSGSTGQPKGVMIDHRGALNTVVDVNRRFGVRESDRVLALSALNFDLSVYDLFGLLAAGGAVVMPAATGARDPGHWLSLVEAHGVTVWNTVPALMEMLVHYVGAGAEAPTLRVVLLSGDWIPVSLPERVRALSPSARVVSLGGATEASIWSILYEVEEVGADWRSIPYGRPMENQQFHVLNEALEPCPVWVTGQLHIGGVGLAQGYWKDEEKSARSFIRHPESGERLYRTGDMGRYLPEGEIEFLGREDTQVKVEGHRIELGEVEAALEGHERVRGAVALAAGPERTKRHLVAYVVLKEALEEDVESPVGGVESPLTMPGFALRETSNEPAAAAHNGNGGPAHAHGGGHGANGVARPAERAGNSASVSQPAAAGRRAGAHAATTSEEFGGLLARLSQLRLDEQPLPKYQYPSAGNLYPVQTYVLVRPGGVEGVEAGLYYYDPRAHQLRLVGDREALRSAAFEPADRTVLEQSAFALFMVARMDAIVPMYGEMSPDFCALEAGYMGRLLTASAGAAGISLRPLTRVDFSHLRESFDVDESHVLVHALAESRLDAAADEPGEHAATLPALTPRVFAGAPQAGVDVGSATAWGQMADLVERGAAQAQTLSKIERLEFKLREVGLRQEAAGEKRLALWKSEADGAFVEEFTYRRSDREFLGRAVAPEPLRELLEVLTHARTEPEGLLCGLRHLPAEQYPVQTYLYVKAGRVAGLAGGVYQHDRQSGALTLLTADVEIDSSAHAEPNREIAEQSAFMLMLVADLGKAGAAFGEWARDLCLLEAGYAGQTLLAEAPVRGLGLCPIGWVDFEQLRRHLRLGDGQVLLHGFLGGGVAPRHKPGDAAARPAADASHPAGARRQQPSAGPRQDAATTEELRAFLGRKLPDYMIPRVIFLLDELPLSANGKVNRNALAALDVGAAGSGGSAVAPRTPVEQQLAGLWRDLLGVERVGVHDTFFALGGDSVTAIRFLARARDAGLDISLPSFFENPTIARLAEAAQPSAPTAADAAPSPTLEPAGGGLDVADFPDADLTQEELDQLIDDFEVPE